MINWQLDAAPRPAILVLPPAAASLDEAHAAIELWEHYRRRRLDPTQRLAVEVMMAQSVAGRWAAATTGREMPRQQGKGDEIEVVELWGLVQRAEAILHTIHDAVLLATQTQQRMLSLIDGHADLRKKKKRAWMGTGQQMIEMRNGGVIWYRTRTGGAGRGVDEVDRLVVDEAQHATLEHISASSPTLLASSDPQINVLGTGGLEGKSEWWWEQRLRALRGDPGEFGYIGHTAERVTIDGDGQPVQPPVDASDRALWRETLPSLYCGRKDIAFFEEQFRVLGERAFAREFLCVWDPPPAPEGSKGWQVITREVWASRRRDDATPNGPLAWAVDASPDGASGAIACSTGTYVEVVEHRPGTGWMPARLLELQTTHSIDAFALDETGPAGALLPALVELGVKWRPVTRAEHAQACGGFLAAVTGDSPDLVHRGQPPLDAAVRDAIRRTVVDVWLWARSKSTGDVCPLVAVTLALWFAGAGEGPSVYEERDLLVFG